ncbi:aryl-alcohol dehydrogenase-like predicted oxidoreductase [Bacillus mesophilus]|uniref:Aldo/keto reductase n=1 Tax=Bacillus mesophilus TaxID=1808955 RepID=A0A6M0Q508_9BACI|nr:aldo/keto reductase [Bacillus mesophilus]MBM7661119.1 aryl-alcohol dehydrogenase-like predicted oxidoreductase [Bacillus mesophilus]NEY71352.1 aldo/keto reductase [Bacillus mesophilus]
MNRRSIGNSELYVSEIGLGCMSLGTEVEKAKSIIDEAIELGVNYLDTADLYDRGVNEEIVGEAIKNKRDSIILATKVGNRWADEQEGWSWDPSKTYIKRAVKDSLRRLQTDYIDLYQLHGGTIEDHIDETIEAFEELKSEGYIRYYGISSIRPNVIREYLNNSSMISAMMQYSMFDRRPEEEILDLLADHSVSVIARGPLARGLLTDAWADRVNEKGYLHLSKEDIENSLGKLVTTLPRRPLQEFALKYCLAHKAVASVIPGASNIIQVRKNIEAGLSIPLTEEEITKIQALIPAEDYQQHR